MQAVLYTHARNNLRELIDRACDDIDEYLITTKDKKQAVLISYDEYNALKETIYLLSSKTNRERLQDAIEQIETAKFHTKEIVL